MSILTLNSEEYDNIVRLVDVHINNGYHINKLPSYDLPYEYYDFWKSVYKKRLRIFIEKSSDYEIGEYIAFNRILKQGSSWKAHERDVFLFIVTDVKSRLVLNVSHMSQCDMVFFNKNLICPTYLKINLSEIKILERNMSFFFDHNICGFIFEDMNYDNLIKIYQMLNQYICIQYNGLISSVDYDIDFSPIVIRHINEIFKRVSPFSVKVSKLTEEMEEHPLFLCHKKFLKFDNDEDSVYVTLKYGY